MYNFDCIENKLTNNNILEPANGIDKDIIFYQFNDTENKKIETLSVYNKSSLSSIICNNYCRIAYEDHKIKLLGKLNNIVFDECCVLEITEKCKVKNCPK
ncbi:hypothetical protein OFR22_11425 [Brachyspira hyodysenteriae]|uniref:hypothetical protein n=1 Tax=Brachyspira hyodysenteriae TaxID=159 RepID=UPI0022CD7627|nr:hypothetical protein [Brachyspira hyodysenteriae]MCZ9838155.1 hypothetical protein [Brachyspira hyodysenteriae]MCZ9840167.1 hypothetical protein [Brachyspira hyodysenteriae]MCZ9848567.1 hypothetical protein [Brachyspira hyodysenteriae]MCZ9849265.1 hypothetical protein [Brachyspira hyodysenteriae]MCZ9851526.1 hypothetical protein [Brachyspira hyodysenteriae]